MAFDSSISSTDSEVDIDAIIVRISELENRARMLLEIMKTLLQRMIVLLRDVIAFSDEIDTDSEFTYVSEIDESNDDDGDEFCTVSEME